MKNDQRDPRHIYANPMDQEVSPILALGMYLNIYAPSPNEQNTEPLFRRGAHAIHPKLQQIFELDGQWGQSRTHT